MKRHTFLFLLACLLTAVLTVPAAAVDPWSVGEGFFPTELGERTVELLYRLPESDGKTLVLAAYDADGVQIGTTVAAAPEAGQVHTLSLRAESDIAAVKLFQLDGDLAPAAPAVTQFPERVATVVAEKHSDTRGLYRDMVDPSFDGEIDEKNVSPGDTVSYYRDPDGSITANVLDYRPYRVTGISGSRVELNDGRYEIALKDFAGFDYEVGDYILAVLSGDEDRVLFSEQAEVVTGTITAMKSAQKQYKINGVFYKNVSETELTLKDEITAVLNRAGQIAMAVHKGAEKPPVSGGEGEDPAPADLLYAVLLDDSCTVFVDDQDREVYAYPVFFDGQEQELSFLAEQTFAPGDIFAYTLNDGIAAPARSALVSGTVEEVAEETRTVAGREFTEIVAVTIDGREYTLDPMAEYTAIYTYSEEEGDFEVCEEDNFTPGSDILFHADENGVIRRAFFPIIES